MIKDDSRKRILASLKKLSHQKEKAIQEEIIMDDLFNNIIWQNSQTIGVTLSMEQEFDTTQIIEKAWQEGKQICIPKTYPKGKMSFFAYTLEEPLTKTSFGVLEPTNSHEIPQNEIDLLIVPGIAFNLAGFRIGFGGGFYDRYLAEFQGATCSLVFKEQFIKNFQPEKHDIAVKKLFFVKQEGENL